MDLNVGVVRESGNEARMPWRRRAGSTMPRPMNNSGRAALSWDQGLKGAKMPFDGGCHCGAVKFTVDAELPRQALSCNCSICRQKGLLLGFFPAARFTLVSGEDALSTYEFNTHKIQHRFCRVCGSQPFAFGHNPDGSEMRAVNLRCVSSVKLESLELQHFDGANK
jgi:hypothetical protein